MTRLSVLQRGSWLLGLIVLIFSFTSCGVIESLAGDPVADVTIAALGVANSTVFRVTVRSVQNLSAASTYALNGQEDVDPVALGEQTSNFVVSPNTIILEIYDASGNVIAHSALDASDYQTEYDGDLTLTRGASQSLSLSPVSSPVPTLGFDISPQQSTLNVLARGLIEDANQRGTYLDRVIPLYCGQGTGTVQPNSALGYFVINDVLIEFNYAFDNPTEFVDILTIKFVESGRNFDNMRLYFKLPGVGRPWYEARTGNVVAQATVLAGVISAVDANNPFEQAEAIADIVISPFGPSFLVETTVKQVTGNCVVGAKSFYVIEAAETPDPAAIKAIGERFDVPTQNNVSELVLLILGNDVEIRDEELTECGNWSPSSSGGSEGTLDRWDVSTIPNGASFSFKFEAYSEPDKFLVEYPTGTVRIDTGWRGDDAYTPPDGGTVTEPGNGEVLNFATKSAGNNTLSVLVTGGNPGTEWVYNLRCDD